MSIRILTGDCLSMMATLPDGCAQTCVTSPPYYGQRQYLPAGHLDMDKQIGIEPTPDEYVARLVAVFREVWRLLRPDGTAFLNLGDSYAASTKGPGGGGSSGLRRDGRAEASRLASAALTHDGQRLASRHAAIPDGCKPKDLLGIPWRVAFALQAVGWWLRSAIVWNKPNPMPESVRDRPTSAYEHVFLLAKSASYYYDADAVREPHVRPRTFRGVAAKTIYRGAISGGADNRHAPGDCGYGQPEGGRNARNVQTWTPTPYHGAHFAVMPLAMADWCIRAGSKPGDTVLDPFAGAGTTGLAAGRLGRSAIVCELNPAYVEMARNRIINDAPLLVAAE